MFYIFKFYESTELIFFILYKLLYQFFLIMTIAWTNLCSYTNTFWTKTNTVVLRIFAKLSSIIFLIIFLFLSRKKKYFYRLKLDFSIHEVINLAYCVEITLVFIMYIHDVTSLFASSNKKASQRWKFWREKHFCVEVNVLLLRVQSTGKVLLCSKKILIKLLVAKLSLC